MAGSQEVFSCQRCGQSFAHSKFILSQHCSRQQSLPLHPKNLHGRGMRGVVLMASRAILGKRPASGVHPAGSAATCSVQGVAHARSVTFPASRLLATTHQRAVVQQHLTHCSPTPAPRSCISRTNADENFSTMLARGSWTPGQTRGIRCTMSSGY